MFPRFLLRLASCLAAYILLAMPAARAQSGTFANPVHPNAADPFVTCARGFYYLLCTDSANDPFESTRPHHLTIRAARSLADLSTATPKTVFTTVPNPKSTNAHNTFYESPELWHFKDRWYIYFTEYANTIHVLESAGDDPLGDYQDRGILNTNTYDATVLSMPDGRLYLLGSTYGSLVIQPLADPTNVGGPQTAIAARDQPWEEVVIEAPSALWHDGQLFLLYTCGGYNKQDYAVGALRFLGGDPTNPAAWKKLPGPLFTQRPSARVWCAGAAAAFTSPDDKEEWFAYSDYNAFDAEKKLGSGPRTIMAQRLTWRPDGTPDLGVPAAPGQPLPLPSGDPSTAAPIRP